MDWLAVAELQYNNKKHAATGRTPFELNFERLSDTVHTRVEVHRMDLEMSRLVK